MYHSFSKTGMLSKAMIPRVAYRYLTSTYMVL
ncbi:unnamed protein product [Tuber melanosporum]|uniref:(Perigord truffle) hypothetical protein n=1 Tax=Tuber melanosporum (strain Mel28) TaxID=656061 RepID=D5GB53_TUBMM|nr:uncharacterized protein GSTUM_00005454001 [Tuber melanosporum]CAZ81746.1 unnamed protein product [Tuber melanosporum]